MGVVGIRLPIVLDASSSVTIFGSQFVSDAMYKDHREALRIGAPMSRLQICKVFTLLYRWRLKITV
jgi:hypothetical protein